MTQLMAVPHATIKARLDAEEAARRRKRTRKSKIAAFRALNDDARFGNVPAHYLHSDTMGVPGVSSPSLLGKDAGQQQVSFPRNFLMDRSSRFFPCGVQPLPSSATGRSAQILWLTAINCWPSCCQR